MKVSRRPLKRPRDVAQPHYEESDDMKPIGGRVLTRHGVYAAPGYHGRAPRETKTGICRELPPVVYFIRTDDGLIKIGHTTQLGNRHRQFGPGQGWENILAVVAGTRADEAAMHKRFAASLAHGREYFHAVPELIAVINDIRERLHVPLIAA